MTEQEFMECRTKILKLRVDGDSFQLGVVALRLLEAVKDDGDRLNALHAAVTRGAISTFDRRHVFSTTRTLA